MAISDYVGKTIIAWHYYNENYEGENASTINKRCYVYPRILKKTDSEFVAISDCESKFPKKGRIEVKLVSDLTAEELYSDVGDIVEIRMNKEPEYNSLTNNYYSLRLKLEAGKSRSDIWIEKFTGKGFTQIISLKEDWDHVQRERQICYFGNIYTNEIMIEYDSRYYGPFEYDKKEDYIALIGIKEHKYFISEYEYSELNDSIYLVDNPDGNDCVRFIVKSAIQSPMDRNNNIDWIDDDKLIEYLSTILKRKKLNTKDEVRRFKENISTLVKEDVEMCLNSSRNERLCRILNLLRLPIPKMGFAP